MNFSTVFLSTIEFTPQVAKYFDMHDFNRLAGVCRKSNQYMKQLEGLRLSRREATYGLLTELEKKKPKHYRKIIQFSELMQKLSVDMKNVASPILIPDKEKIFRVVSADKYLNEGNFWQNLRRKIHFYLDRDQTKAILEVKAKIDKQFTEVANQLSKEARALPYKGFVNIRKEVLTRIQRARNLSNSYKIFQYEIIDEYFQTMITKHKECHWIIRFIVWIAKQIFRIKEQTNNYNKSLFGDVIFNKLRDLKQLSKFFAVTIGSTKMQHTEVRVLASFHKNSMTIHVGPHASFTLRRVKPNETKVIDTDDKVIVRGGYVPCQTVNTSRFFVSINYHTSMQEEPLIYHKIAQVMMEILSRENASAIVIDARSEEAQVMLVRCGFGKGLRAGTFKQEREGTISCFRSHMFAQDPTSQSYEKYAVEIYNESRKEWELKGNFSPDTWFMQLKKEDNSDDTDQKEIDEIYKKEGLLFPRGREMFIWKREQRVSGQSQFYSKKDKDSKVYIEGGYKTWEEIIKADPILKGEGPILP